jgi:hypothetical protein
VFGGFDSPCSERNGALKATISASSSTKERGDFVDLAPFLVLE